jgi:hypothetical protein
MSGKTEPKLNKSKLSNEENPNIKEIETEKAICVGAVIFLEPP